MAEMEKKEPEEKREEVKPETRSEESPEQKAEGTSFSEVDELRRQLELKETEAKENYDRFLRQAAELENFKKRAAREKGEAIRYANENLIRDLLPVLDNLERAVEHAGGGGNGKPLLEGVEMVLKGFVDVLEKYGLTVVSAKGEPFDPEKHEAIAHVESEEYEPNIIVEEHQKGYYLLDRLLRPALVSVSKPSEPKKERREDGGEVEKGSRDD